MIETMKTAVAALKEEHLGDLCIYAVDDHGVDRLFPLNEPLSKIEAWSKEVLRSADAISVAPLLVSARLWHSGYARWGAAKRLAASVSHHGYVSCCFRCRLPVHEDGKRLVNELGLSFGILDNGVFTGVIQTAPQTERGWLANQAALDDYAKTIGEPRKQFTKGDCVLLGSTVHRGNVAAGMRNRSLIYGREGVQNSVDVAARISSSTKTPQRVLVSE